MRHDPEGDAARLLGGTMPADEQQRFSEHLLRCPQCWDEVDAARRGRSLAETARTVAPPALRDRVRALVEAEAMAAPAAPAVAGHRRRRRRWLVPALSLIHI